MKMFTIRIDKKRLREFEHQFPDEDACLRWLAKQRWPERVRCPRCRKPVRSEPAKIRMTCVRCRGGPNFRFSPITRFRPFAETRLPLRIWLMLIYLDRFRPLVRAENLVPVLSCSAIAVRSIRRRVRTTRVPRFRKVVRQIEKITVQTAAVLPRETVVASTTPERPFREQIHFPFLLEPPRRRRKSW